MDLLSDRRRVGSHLLMVAAIGVGLYCLVLARAEPFPADPVEGLRKILRNPLQADAALVKRLETAKPEDRFKMQAEILERNLTDKIQAIRQIGDLRRALLLQEWPQEETRREHEIGAAERRARAQ